MPSHRQNWFEGWRLFAALALILVGLYVWITAMRQFEVDRVHMVIRFTARTLLLFFCLALSAGAALVQWLDALATPQPPLSGVTFAVSHALQPRYHCFRHDGARWLCGGDQSRLLHLRWHRLCLHHRDDCDLDNRTRREIGPRAWRNVQLMSAAILFWIQLHDLVRQADSRHAILCTACSEFHCWR